MSLNLKWCGWIRRLEACGWGERSACHCHAMNGILILIVTLNYIGYSDTCLSHLEDSAPMQSPWKRTPAHSWQKILYVGWLNNRRSLARATSNWEIRRMTLSSLTAEKRHKHKEWSSIHCNHQWMHLDSCINTLVGAKSMISLARLKLGIGDEKKWGTDLKSWERAELKSVEI